MLVLVVWYPRGFNRLHTLHPWYWNSLLYALISFGETSAHFLQLMPFTILQFSFHQVPINAGWAEAEWNEKFAWHFYTWPAVRIEPQTVWSLVKHLIYWVTCHMLQRYIKNQIKCTCYMDTLALHYHWTNSTADTAVAVHMDSGLISNWWERKGNDQEGKHTVKYPTFYSINMSHVSVLIDKYLPPLSVCLILSIIFHSPHVWGVTYSMSFQSYRTVLQRFPLTRLDNLGNQGSK